MRSLSLNLLELFFSVAYVSRSGGMSNELNNIVARNANGVYEGVAIGGDRSEASLLSILFKNIEDDHHFDIII